MKISEMAARLKLADEILVTVSDHYRVFAVAVAGCKDGGTEACNLLHETHSRLVEALVSISQVQEALANREITE